MNAERRGRYLKVGIAALYIGVILWSLTVSFFGPFSWLLRVSGLVGMLSLSLAALMTPFIAQIRAHFGASFLQVHHLFAALGLILATLHPIILALQTLDPGVFLPSFATLDIFLALGGRMALILMYIALAAIPPAAPPPAECLTPPPRPDVPRPPPEHHTRQPDRYRLPGSRHLPPLQRPLRRRRGGVFAETVATAGARG